MTRVLPAFALSSLLVALTVCTGPARAAEATSEAEPLVLGETFVLHSRVLDEDRRINVFTPPRAPEHANDPLPTLYMPDGGILEDFPHIMGLVQIGALNGTMRPFRLVGIENTQRRRDLTGPTEDERDREIAPHVGGSAAFRDFLRKELIPAIEERYPTTDERAIVGESLAGLFVVETFLREPGLFDIYIAADPSLWWNRYDLVERANDYVDRQILRGRSLYMAHSDQEEIGEATERLGRYLQMLGIEGFRVRYQAFSNEQHHSIFHPAALAGFRWAMPVVGGDTDR